jgi:acyl carrier protein
MATTLDRVRDIVVDPGRRGGRSRQARVRSEADSLNLVELIMAFEEGSGEISDGCAKNLTVGEAITYVERRMVASKQWPQSTGRTPVGPVAGEHWPQN